ncbi:putative Vacuolar sorting-associated protein 13, N-terminal [Blattamonas nauphoetae]|uniref:Vacuolar sorting-associated protein 13, N-terminal n=1 Tax=Blattamonas nauphoetae TaxID=2049346 RepID=A0ABQ9XTE6_9EUKA|nr:putative Vacuolar sorting-associated protein 13, N-terminal [Blattamonas nauphoetae]
MRLRPGVNELIPNVDIRSGFIGSVYGKVHLSQLSKAPFSFDIRDAYFLVTTPEVDPSPAATKRRIHQEKDRLYRRFRDFDRKYAIEEPDSVSSTLESAIAIFRTKLVDYLVNSNVSMKRVHIRYEDATDISSPQGFGFLLDSMSIKTTNELWRKPVNRADVTGYKLAQFNGLSVYWTQGFLSTDGTDVINKLHEISQDRTHLKGFHMIIDNLCAVLKMKFTKPYLLEKRPLIDTSCYIKSLTIHVGEQQLNPIITMLLNTSTSDEKQHYQNIRPFTGRLGIDTLRKSQSLDELKHQKSQSSRPLQSEQSILPAPPSAFTTTLRSLVTERSRLLWGWAIFCVLKDVRQRRQSADLKFIVTQRRKDRLQYIVGRMEWINALEQIQTGTIPARFWTNESVERTKHLVRARLQKTYELYWLNMVEQEAENTVTNKPIVASEEHVKEIARLKTIVDTEWKKTQRMEKLPDLAFLSRGSEHRYQSKSSVHGSASSVDEKALQNWEKQMLKDQQVTNSRFKIDGDDPITPMNPRDLKELGIDAVNLMKMIELENSYPYDDIIYFRTIADSQAIAEGRGWVAEKEKEDDVLVDDRALTMRELRKSRETEKTEVSIVSDSLPSELPSDNSDVPSDNSDSPIEINVNTLSEQEIVDIEDDLPPIFIPIKLISNNVDVNSQASSPSQSTNNHDHFSPISPSSGPTTPVNSARTRSTQLPYQPQPSVDKSWSLFRINYTIDTFSTILYESPTNSALQSGRWSSFHPLVDLKFVNITGSFGYRPISRGMDLVMCIDDGIIQDISRRRENLYKTLFRKLPQSINEARTESPTFFTPTSTPGLPPITASPHTFSNSNQPMKPPPEPINPLIRIEFSTNPVNSWSVILTHMSVAASQNVLSPALLLRLAHTFQSIFLFRNLPPNNTRPDEATTENTNRQTPHPPFTRLPFSQTEEQQQLTRQFLTLLDTIPTTLLDNVLHRLPLDLIIQVGQFDVIVPLHSDSAKTDSILFSFDSFHFIADSSQLKSSAINPSTSAKSMRKRSVFSNLLFSSSASSSREQQRFLQTHPILSKTAFGLPPFPPIEWYDNPDDWTIENLFDQYHMSLSGLRLGITDVEVSAEDPDLDEVDTEAVTYSSANLEEQVVVTFDPDKIQWLCENITVESTIQFSLFQHSSLIPQRLIFVNIGEISLIVNKDHIVRFLNIVKNLVPLFTNQTERLASLFPEQSSHFPSEDQFRAILLDTQDYSRINKALSRSIPAMPPNRLLYNMSVLRKHLQVCFIEKTKFGTKTIRQHIKSEDVVVRALHGTVGLISLRVGSEVTSYAKETRAPYTIQVEFRLVEMSLLYRLLSRSGELSVGNINVTHPTPSGPQSLFSRLHLVTDPHPLIKNLQDTHQPKQFPLTFQFDDGNGLPIIPPFTARTLSLIQLSRVRESSHTPPWIQKYLRRISPPDHIDLVQPTPTPFSIPIPTTPIEANLHPIQNNPPFEDILPHDAVHLSLSTNRDDTTKQRLQIELGPLFGRVDGETIGFMSGITYSSLKHFVALMPFLVRTGKANHFRYNRVERSQNEWKKQKNLEDSVLNSFTCSRDFHIDVKLDQVLWNHQLSHSSSDGSIFSRISSSPLSLSIQSSTSGPDPTAKILIRNGDVSIQISDRTSCPLIDSELVGISMDLILQMKTSTRGGLISPPIFGCSMAGSFCIDTPRSNHSHNRLPLLTPAKFSMRVTSPNQDGCLFNSDQSVDTPHSYQQRIIERRDSYCLSMNFEDLIKIALTPRTVETLAHIIHLVTMQADPPDGVLMSDNPALINICLMNQTPYALFAQPQSSQTVESEDEKCINNTTLRICPDSTSHIHLTLDTKQTPMHFFVRFALLAFDIVPQFITESSLRWTPTISLTFSDSQRMLAIRSPLENGGRFITLLISNHLISKNYCSIRICEVHRTVSPLVPRMPVHNLSEFLQKDHDTSDSFLHPTLSSSVTLQNATRFSATIAEHDEKDNTLELLPFSSSDMSFSTSSQESIDITFSLRGQSSSLTISPTQEDPTSHIFHVDGIDEEVLVTTQSSSGRTTIICKLASDQEEYTPNLPLFLIHTSLMIPQLSLQVFSEPIENPFLSITLPDLRFLDLLALLSESVILHTETQLKSQYLPAIHLLTRKRETSTTTPLNRGRMKVRHIQPVTSETRTFENDRSRLIEHITGFSRIITLLHSKGTNNTTLRSFQHCVIRTPFRVILVLLPRDSRRKDSEDKEKEKNG